ncbi:MAG: glycosyltransferase family 2 protein [Pirellulales bacterium]|nr:glycosyltransferase family 2 protein [Pirellulales bacterium]
MPLVSIVVPVFHNSGSLPELLRQLDRLSEVEPEEFEFILVDDGSRDSSFAVMQELVRRDSRVYAIKLARNFGSNAASTAGITLARGDAVVAISADLQDPPELIHQMLEKWRSGYRVVLAARESRRDPWLSSAFSAAFWKLFRHFALPNMPAKGCDYCLLDRQVLNALKDTNEPGAGLGMVLWTGFEPAVLHYHRRERDPRFGRSMWTWSKRLTYLIDSFVSFSHMPVRAASVLGIALGTVGVLYALAIVFSKLFLGGQLPEAYASVIVAILVVGGVQLLMIGILGEYLVRVLEATRKRPPFIIERVVHSGAAPIEGSLPRDAEVPPAAVAELLAQVGPATDIVERAP